jgi:hypothetical protein
VYSQGFGRRVVESSEVLGEGAPNRVKEWSFGDLKAKPPEVEPVAISATQNCGKYRRNP